MEEYRCAVNHFKLLFVQVDVFAMADVSPEVLSKLAELIKATGGAGAPHGSTFLDYLKSFTEFLSAVAWPAAAVLCVLLFRRQVTNFLGDVETVKVFGAEISRKINKQIEQSAKEAQTKTDSELRSGPSKGELNRAMVVKDLAADTNSGVVAAQAEALAAEYERLRASMLPGNDRTRAMEVVVSKMRTIGQAFFPIRHEFAGSASPGKRLMAIASLQVSHDYEMLDWLAERVGSEKAFLQYQALVAILLAVQGNNAKAYIPSLEAAVKEVSRFKDNFGGDISRTGTLEEIEKALADLKRAAQKQGASVN
jgi:hypothetical protein